MLLSGAAGPVGDSVRPQEEAFTKMDEDSNGILEGKEFRLVAESAMFNIVPADRFKKYAIFGMGSDLFFELHKAEIEAAGHEPGDLFSLHDEDSNERLSKEEYLAVLKKFRSSEL